MILDIIYTLLIISVGFTVPNSFLVTKDRHWKKQLDWLWAFHILTSIAFYFFTRNGAGDAWDYWTTPRDMTSAEFYRLLFEETGTYFIYSLNYIPANVLAMSFFTNTILYALIGYIGLVLFFITAIKTIPLNTVFKGYKLFPLLFFLPNLHFWSAGLGKDTILFFCIGAFAYGLLNISKRIPLLILSVALSYLIRPHITLFLFVAFGLAYLFDAKTSGLKRFFLIVLLIGGGAAVFPTVMKFASIENASVESIDNRLSHQAELLSEGAGSAVDISSYPFPLKVATFLYRPFFFDINGIPAVIASLENLLLLILTLKAISYKPVVTFKAAPFVIKGFLFFLLIGTAAFSLTLGNLGIMLRMRNMLLPGMLIYFLWAYSYRKETYLILKGKIDRARSSVKLI